MDSWGCSPAANSGAKFISSGVTSQASPPERCQRLLVSSSFHRHNAIHSSGKAIDGFALEGNAICRGPRSGQPVLFYNGKC